MRYIIIGFFIIIACLIGVRTLSGEDDWTCKNGKWVTHGKPAFPHPNTKCIKK